MLRHVGQEADSNRQITYKGVEEMPFKPANKTEDHLPASQREAADDGSEDTEGQAKIGRRQGDEYLPPAERAASDDGESDTEGHAKIGR